LLTGARAPVTLELARLFKQAGYTVFVADSLPWTMCHGSTAVTKVFRVPAPAYQPVEFINRLIEIIRQNQIELLIPTCEEIYFVAMGHKKLEACCRVFAPDIQTLLHLHNKWLFIQQARNLGLTVPVTRLITDIAQVATQPPTGAVVLKPAFSRFAARVIIQPQNPLETLAGIGVSTRQPWVIQQFVTGRQLCTYSVACQGTLTAHSCYPTTYTAGQGASIVFTPVDHPATLNWVQSFVSRTQFSGQIAFDFIESAEGQVWAIECNPRTTSGIHLFAGMASLTDAFTTPNSSLQTPASGSSKLITSAMLLYALRRVRSITTLKSWWHSVRTGQDVIFRATDPAPALVSQWLMVGQLFALSLRLGVSLPEASTADIEWNGEAVLELTG
jgi:predicted ATP-grasp superfamily ATP-dependent carboligase